MKETPYWQSTVDSGLSTVDSRLSTGKPPPSRVDVAIVGGGYTGLSAGRYLADRGASVVVLEREEIGWGASSRNAGQVLTGLRVAPLALVRRRGEAAARRLFDASLHAMERLETLIASERIDCGYERSGHIEAAVKPSHFEHLRAEQAVLSRVFGHRVEIVSKSEQRSEVGSSTYHGILVDERSGRLNPARYLHGLAAAAERTGAVLAPKTPVERIGRQASDRWSVTTGRGTIEATDVLMATNGYTDKALPGLRRRLVPVGSYIIVTEPLTPENARTILPKCRTAFDSKRFVRFFRLTEDHRLLFGGRAEFSTPGPETTRRAAEILRVDLVTIFPELIDARIEFAWGGNVAFARDELPHAGRLDGAYYAGGYGGHGIAMATYLGELIARRIAGDAVDHPFVDDHFEAIPFYNGRPWFLPLVGLYYRFLDLID